MFTLTINKKEITFKRPIVMGIINVTADSFYSESRKQTISDVLFTTENMLKNGARIIDVGAQSTRPQSELISADDELKKLIPVIESLKNNFPEAIISVDTFYSTVAQQALDAGAHIINDIGGGNLDAKMLETIATLNVPYICMHIKGTPQTMQQHTQYSNVVDEVKKYFTEKIELANQLNIKNFIIDVGFGFAKTVEQNFELLKNLSQFSSFQKPLLIGVSRKSSIYKTLNITAQEALNGTTVLHTIALLNGANILRAHDVKEAVEAIQLTEHFM